MRKQRLSNVLERQARKAFIGRDAELGALLRVLEPGGPRVAFVYGIAGIGKSSLLAAFAEEARRRGASVVRLDCRAVEPTEQGFLAELGRAVGGRAARAEEAAACLGGLGSRVVLALDT